MRYLLDANILSALIRNQPGPLDDHIRRVGKKQIYTSILVAAELRYGVAKKRSARLSQRVDQLLQAIPVLPFETPADTIFGEIRVELERKGRPIGSNDMLIAAHTIALDMILVTNNEREFKQVFGLKLENWLR